MKGKKTNLAVLASFAGALLMVPNTFAAVGNYGMAYEGGVDLGAEGTVTPNAELISSLTKLIGGGTSTTTDYALPTTWQDGFYKKDDGGCTPIKYLKVGQDGLNDVNGLSVTKDNGNYKYVATIKGITVDTQLKDNLGDSNYFEVDFGNGDTGSHVRLGGRVYSDQACENLVSDIMYLSGVNSEAGTQGKAYVNLNIDLYKSGTNTRVKSDQLYFAFDDIDGSQSYKLINNELTPQNMFAASDTILQPTTGNLRNKFVTSENGNYIYSQPHIVMTGADLYVKLADAAQTNGLDVVFGYGANAASQITFYGKQYTVNYVAEEGGAIAGITTEKVLSGNNPTGTSLNIDEAYELVGWTADKKVKLADGTEIKAGDAITAEQIKSVKVAEDVIFTATFKLAETAPEVEVPDTGASTEEMNAIFAPASIGALLFVALAAVLTSRVLHKRIGFGKK